MKPRRAAAKPAVPQSELPFTPAAEPTVPAAEVPRPARLPASSMALVKAVLQHPGKPLEAYRRAIAELLKVACGRSDIEPLSNDRRFADPVWRESPFYQQLMQGHLAVAREIQHLAGELGLGPRDEARARMMFGLVTDMLAPTNTLWGNPAALKRTLETGGRNLVTGSLQMFEDWRNNGGLPASVDRDSFDVGETLALTPGDVVHRSELLELIQYRPQTPTVHGTPLFIVPPQINKYYLWDLAPGRSLIEFLVQQGFQVYVVSWFNPSAAQSDWGLENYVLALEEAMEVARSVSKASQLHLLGACSGGITAATLGAHLAAQGKDWVRSLTLLVAVLDVTAFADSAMGSFMHLETLELARMMSGATGALEGQDLAKVFAWLRPNELVWSYWVNNYLLGKKPPAFDILYWNSDTTRLPARLHADFINLLETNGLARPGGVKMAGRSLDLRQLRCDSYILGGRTDHITPWEGCYRTRALLGGHSDFVLCSSGHVQSIVSPPGNPKASFLTGPQADGTPEEFEAHASATEGSWWPHLAEWLAGRSAARKRAPKATGSRAHPAICPAPGTYVRAAA